MTFSEQVYLELIKAGSSILVALGVGQRIVVYWNLRQKRRELELAATVSAH